MTTPIQRRFYAVKNGIQMPVHLMVEGRENPLYGVWLTEKGCFTRQMGLVHPSTPLRVFTEVGFLPISRAVKHVQRFIPAPSIVLGVTGFSDDTLRISVLAQEVVSLLITPNFFHQNGPDPALDQHTVLDSMNTFLSGLGTANRMGLLCRVPGPAFLRRIQDHRDQLPENILRAVLHSMDASFPAFIAAKYLLLASERDGGFTLPAFASAKEAERLFREFSRAGHPDLWAAKMVRNRLGLEVIPG